MEKNRFLANFTFNFLDMTSPITHELMSRYDQVRTC